jgi:hypothetical protein
MRLGVPGITALSAIAAACVETDVFIRTVSVVAAVAWSVIAVSTIATVAAAVAGVTLKTSTIVAGDLHQTWCPCIGNSESFRPLGPRSGT